MNLRLPAFAEIALVGVTLAAATFPVAAQAPELAAAAWTVDHDRSRLGFAGTVQGEGFTGQFNGWDAVIHFDPDNLPASMAEISVDMASAETGDATRDQSLPESDWFAAKLFPRAIFKTTSIAAAEGEGNYIAEGTLTIRDISQPVTLPFTLRFSGDRALMTGTLSLDRSTFGIGQGAWEDDKTVSYGVDLDLRVVAEKAG